MDIVKANRALSRMVSLEAIWSHEEWRSTAVQFLEAHDQARTGLSVTPLKLLVDSSDPAQFLGGESYSDRLWRNAARMVLNP